MRRLVADVRLTVDDLVAPLFVADGLETPRPVASRRPTVPPEATGLPVTISVTVWP